MRTPGAITLRHDLQCDISPLRASSPNSTLTTPAGMAGCSSPGEDDRGMVRRADRRAAVPPAVQTDLLTGGGVRQGLQPSSRAVQDRDVYVGGAGLALAVGYVEPQLGFGKTDAKDVLRGRKVIPQESSKLDDRRLRAILLDRPDM